MFCDNEKGVMVMSFFYGISSDAASTFFSTSSSTSTGATGNILSDYYSIKNGSYKKLLNAYYSIDDNKNKSYNTSISSDSTKLLASIETSAEALKESADELIMSGNKSVFAKNEDGTYNTEAILDKIKKFVSDYNDVLDATEKSNTKNIASSSASMITFTKTNSLLLAKVGIGLESDGKLSVNEETFKKSDMSTVKSIFNGKGSYAYQISAKASMINFYADNEANKSNTYTNGGTYSYNYSSGDILNKLY